MELFKIFKFDGIWQAGQRMAAPGSFFRRFTNAFKDKTGRILPFGKGQNLGSNEPFPLPISGATWDSVVASDNFLEGIFRYVSTQVVDSGPVVISCRFSDYTNSPRHIMQPYSDLVINANKIPQIGLYVTRQPSHAFGSVTVLRKNFLNYSININEYLSTDATKRTLSQGNLFVFDGIRVRAAGLPTPWNGVEGGAGAHYVRTIYATIGLDGEPVFSPFLQQQAGVVNPTIYLGQYTTLTNFSNTRRVDAITGAPDVSPTSRRPGDSLFNQNKYYDTRYVRISTGISLSIANFPVATRQDSSRDLEVGDWLLIHVPQTTLFPNLPANTLMFQIRALGSVGAPITFERFFKFYNVYNLTWEEGNFETIWNDWTTGERNQFISLTGDFGALSNIFQIICYATTASGNYRVSTILPCMHFSTNTRTGVTLTSYKSFDFPFLGVVTSFLADWYDVSTAKTSFPLMLGITNYKELLLGHDYNAIYFSDFTLGGSTEMVSGSTNLVPNGSEFGDITAICGSEDFLLISRERKNYVLRGDVAGQFSITECDLPIEGAYNSKACANVWGGRIVFMNRTGIYVVSAEGMIKDISEPIKDLFIGDNIDNNLFNKNIFRTPEQKIVSEPFGPNLVGYARDGGQFKITLDAERGLIYFLTCSKARVQNTVSFDEQVVFTATPNILVYDTRDGAWYEWECGDATTIESVFGRALILGADFFKEDGQLRGLEKQTITFQYNTAGEPSLEKQVTQIKLYGGFDADTTGRLGCLVKQQNDWSKVGQTLVTDDVYLTTDVDKYNHKKRLNSSKAQAVSISLESLPEGGIFLEGIEVEGTMVQDGVKK